MDRREQVTQWVEKKIGKVLNEDIKKKIVDENSTFDVESYVNNLVDKYFNERDIEKLKESLNTDSYYDSYYLESENSSEEQSSVQNSLGLEPNEYQTFPVEEIIKNLQNDSEEVRKRFLRVLEASAEDLISQNFCNQVIEILQKNLNMSENLEILGLILKIFQKVLKSTKKPQIICKGFTSVAEVLANQIDIFNSQVDKTFEKIYDIKEEKWICEKKLSGLECRSLKNPKNSNFVNPEVLIKLMWLLIDCQLQIRIKGIRFNETKFREIIFSFIHLLSSTTSSEDSKLSGLELVSVLDPKANWCRYWCHTAVGRTLLCSALRKYKSFFIHIIEIMLKHMKIRKRNRLPSVVKAVNSNEISPKFKNEVRKPAKLLNKTSLTAEPGEKEKFSQKREILKDRDNSICSAPNEHTDNKKKEEFNKRKKKALEWIIEEIPRKVVGEAVFFHSVSLVSCLIQFRSGRALFPIQTTTKKRLLNVQDLSFSIIEHLENLEYNKCDGDGVGYTSAYQAKVLEILNNLKKLKTPVNSSRVSKERQQFCYF